MVVPGLQPDLYRRQFIVRAGVATALFVYMYTREEPLNDGVFYVASFALLCLVIGALFAWLGWSVDEA